MIELRGVTKTYGSKKAAFTALDNVSVTIPEGATVAIVGKSGSGKSTLMHAMSGLDRPEAGEVLIDGQDILKLKSRQIDQFRAHKIGFIFQAFFVQANDTCYQNVVLPLEIARVPRGERRALVDAALEQLVFVRQLDDGLAKRSILRLALAHLGFDPEQLALQRRDGRGDVGNGQRRRATSV